MRSRTTVRARQRGQTLVESALVLLVFCLTVFGTMDFAVMSTAANFVAYAAGEGARYAIVHGTASGNPTTAAGVQTYVQSIATGIPNGNAVSVATTWPVDQNPGSLVRVVVTYTYQPITFLGLKASIPISAQSQMVIRQ